MEKKGFAGNLIVAIAAIAILGAAIYLGVQYFPKTGDALPAQALTITVCSMTALLLHRRKKHNR